MSRYFLKLAFDGTDYHGWQSQNNATTIQQTLNHALTLVIGETISLTGAGRTDTGVHARNYYAHFDTGDDLDLPTRKKLVHKLNRFLPQDIVIYEILPVRSNANARYAATLRTYKYYFHTFKDPFADKYSQYLYGKIDLPLMNTGAELLVSTSDFTSFSKVGTDTKTNICKVTYAEWTIDGYNLVFTISADRFLRNMVRAIVGTLIELGRGKITLNDLEKIISQKNRCDAGESVPAKGLFLEKIDYPERIFLP